MNSELKEPLSLTRLEYGSSIALGAFTERTAMLSEVRRIYADGERTASLSWEHVCTTNPDSLSPVAVFWEDAGEQGDSLSLDPGFGYTDLSQVHRGFLGTQNWNDVISSLSWCRFDVSLFDAINWTGNEFFAVKGCNTPDLAPFGWSDEAASIANWGT